MVQVSGLKNSESNSPPSPADNTNSPGENTSLIDDPPCLGTAARCRTAVACDKCRERKTKCSGEKPVCNRCSSRGLICIYVSRDAKRRTYSHTPRSFLRHAHGLQEDRLRIMIPDNATSSVSSGTAHYLLPPYPTRHPPSVGTFLGVESHSSIVASNSVMPAPSYYHPVYTPSESEYHSANRSDSPEFGESLLGSAPHTPPEGSASVWSGDLSSNLICCPFLFQPEPSSNYSSQLSYPQPHPYFSMGSHNSPQGFVSLPSSGVPSQNAQYNRVEHSLSRPLPLQTMKSSHDCYGYRV